MKIQISKVISVVSVEKGVRKERKTKINWDQYFGKDPAEPTSIIKLTFPPQKKKKI